MNDLVRSHHCVDMFRRVAHLPGDAAECGVAFGQTTFLLDHYVFDANKKLYAFDTFEGLPYDDSISSEFQCKRGEMNYGAQFFDQYDRLKMTSIVPVAGLVEDTLKRYADKQFCFVWLDMDLYQPTSFSYKFFEDRMVQGGIIGFHDYQFIRCPGVQEVVDQEVDNAKYEQIFLQNNCLFLRRR